MKAGRVAKQRRRREHSEGRRISEALGYYDWQSRPHAQTQHIASNDFAKLAAKGKIPKGWEPISNKWTVAFRLPKYNKYFVDSEGAIGRAAYNWEPDAFGHGPRLIVRKIREEQPIK